MNGNVGETLPVLDPKSARKITSLILAKSEVESAMVLQDETLTPNISKR